MNDIIRGVDASLGDCPPPPTPTLRPPTPSPNPENQIPPLGGEELLNWLREGRYLDWEAEPAPHASLGPHFGAVRTFVNQSLYRSLQILPPFQRRHPQSAAAVKELFGPSGSEVRGWSVSIKVDTDSQGGGGWYWYERYDGSVFADGMGAAACTGCHGSDSEVARSHDYVLTYFPLRACNPGDEGHGNCGTLLTPGLDCAYDGEVHYAGLPGPLPMTLYMIGGEFFLDGNWYYAHGRPGELAYSGTFSLRYCASDFPVPVQGSINLSQGNAILTFIEYTESGEPAVTFTGRRRH